MFADYSSCCWCCVRVRFHELTSTNGRKWCRENMALTTLICFVYFLIFISDRSNLLFCVWAHGRLCECSAMKKKTVYWEFVRIPVSRFWTHIPPFVEQKWNSWKGRRLSWIITAHLLGVLNSFGRHRLFLAIQFYSSFVCVSRCFSHFNDSHNNFSVFVLALYGSAQVKSTL